MISRVLFFIICLFYFETGFSQTPSIQWHKKYGGSLDDAANFIYKNNKGNYMVLGYAISTDFDVTNHFPNLPGYNDEDVWLIEIDSLGNVIRNICYGGSGGETGHSLMRTFDNGYIIEGETSSTDGEVTGVHGLSDDCWVVKTDSNGTFQWQTCLGGSNQENGFEIIQTIDSGYLVTGGTESMDGDVVGLHGTQFDAIIIKLDKNGSKQWVKVYGGTQEEEAISCRQTSDGNYLISGDANSHDGDVNGVHGNFFTSDVWILKLDTIGQIIWQKCYGGSNNEWPNGLALSSDGGFIVSASSLSNDGDVSGNHGNEDFWLIKADSLGNIEWQKCYGGSGGESASGFNTTTDGGFIMAGWSGIDNGMVSGNHGAQDYWVVKIDSGGNFQWGKCLGGSNIDVANSVVEASDGGYLVAGYSQSIDGDATFNNHHGSNKDAWVVKLAPLGLSVPGLENNLMDLNVSQVNDQLNLRFFSKINERIEFFLYDMTGKLMIQKENSISEGINYHQIDCTGMSGGVYFLSIVGKNVLQREKVFIH